MHIAGQQKEDEEGQKDTRYAREGKLFVRYAVYLCSGAHLSLDSPSFLQWIDHRPDPSRHPFAAASYDCSRAVTELGQRLQTGPRSARHALLAAQLGPTGCCQ